MSTSYDRMHSHPLSGRCVCLFTALYDRRISAVVRAGYDSKAVGLPTVASLIRALEPHSFQRIKLVPVPVSSS